MKLMSATPDVSHADTSRLKLVALANMWLMSATPDVSQPDISPWNRELWNMWLMSVTPDVFQTDKSRLKEPVSENM